MSDNKIYKNYAVETKAVDEEQGIYEAMVSTESVDRDNDVMLAVGAEIDNYLKNPVVLFGHNYRSPEAVVGKALEVIKIPGVGVRLVFQFIERGVSKAADLVRDLWASGYLRAMSIGFIPKAWERRKDSEGEELPPQLAGRIYTLWELLEGSIVTVPANQDALRLAYDAMREKGYSEQELKGVLVEPGAEEMLASIRQELQERSAELVELYQALRRKIEAGNGEAEASPETINSGKAPAVASQAEAAGPSVPEPNNDETLPETGATHDASDGAGLGPVAEALLAYLQTIQNQITR